MMGPISCQLTTAVSYHHHGGASGDVDKTAVGAQSEGEVPLVHDGLVPIHFALHAHGAVALEKQGIRPSSIVLTRCGGGGGEEKPYWRHPNP